MVEQASDKRVTMGDLMPSAEERKDLEVRFLVVTAQLIQRHKSLTGSEQLPEDFRSAWTQYINARLLGWPETGRLLGRATAHCPPQMIGLLIGLLKETRIISEQLASGIVSALTVRNANLPMEGELHG